MKLTQEELQRVDNLRGASAASYSGVQFLISCIDKLQKEEPRMRFEKCACYGWGGYVDGIDPNCKTCKGRGIVHVGTW